MKPSEDTQRKRLLINIKVEQETLCVKMLVNWEEEPKPQKTSMNIIKFTVKYN